MIEPCIFSYISSFIFVIGIVCYSYILYVDSMEENGTRTKTDTVWVWGLYILLFMGLFVSLYCYIPNDDLTNEFSEKIQNLTNNFSNRFGLNPNPNTSIAPEQYISPIPENGINFVGNRILGNQKRILKNTPIVLLRT